VLRAGIVATNQHVIGGQTETTVLVPGGGQLPARIVYVDQRNDVALLRVPGLRAAPLPALQRSPAGERRAVLLGYPRDGRLTAVPATSGAPENVFTPRLRRVVPLRARVVPGDSGGPVLDARGRVLAMTFAAARAGGGGFAVPIELVRRGLETPLRRVSPGPCAG
jgi:S1-C subfamily serine protease